MKTGKIITKLEKLFGIDEAQKSTDRQLNAVIQLIDLLEAKQSKFRHRIDNNNSQTDLAKIQRKLSLTEIHLAKARAYRNNLESQKV